MKSIFVILVTLGVLGVSQVKAQDYYQQQAPYPNQNQDPYQGQDQDQDQSQSSGLKQYYEGLRPISLRILQEAISKTHSQVYEDMYNALSNADIIDGSQSYPGCDGHTAALTHEDGRTIVVCTGSDEGFNIRTLLHESVHLTGNFNECDADYYSGMAEIDSGEGITGPGGYDCPGNP